MYQPSPNPHVETYAVARYDVGKAFKRAWDPETQPNQWKALTELVTSKNPNKIGVNFAKDYGHADGLTHFDHEELVKNLPAGYPEKVVSAQMLAVRWQETRTPSKWLLKDIFRICLLTWFRNDFLSAGPTIGMWYNRIMLPVPGISHWMQILAIRLN